MVLSLEEPSTIICSIKGYDCAWIDLIVSQIVAELFFVTVIIDTSILRTSEHLQVLLFQRRVFDVFIVISCCTFLPNSKFILSQISKKVNCLSNGLTFNINI